MNQAPHNLDLWQWIVGMPESVVGFCDFGKYHNIEVEDDVTIFARYNNGATGVFITTTGECPGTNRLEISGTKGKLVLEGGVIKYTKLSMDEREYCFQSDSGFKKCEWSTEEIRVEGGGGPQHNGIRENVVNAILNGAGSSPRMRRHQRPFLCNAAILSLAGQPRSQASDLRRNTGRSWKSASKLPNRKKTSPKRRISPAYGSN